MPLFSFDGHRPQVHETAWIAPTASIIGDVIIEENVSIWFNVVVRSDFGPIAIRAGANVQDCSVVHGGPTLTEIGPGATIGHLCMVHGATIGKEALIGNGSTLLDGVVVGDGAMIAAASMVTPNTVVPAGMLAIGAPAKVKGPLTDAARRWVEGNPQAYLNLSRRYAETSREVD